MSDYMKEKYLFANNLKYLIESRNIKRRDLADCIGVGLAAINSYEYGISWPSIPKAISIAKKFDISIDCLLNYDIKQLELEKNWDPEKPGLDFIPFGKSNYNKYLGNNYWLYLYDNHVENGPKINQLKLEIIPNIKKKRYDICILTDNEDEKIKYLGNFVLEHNHAYIYLRGIEHHERALITVHNPENETSKPYIGGIGTIASISHGYEKDPCVQKILIINKRISKDNIDINNNELFSILKIQCNANVIKVDKDEDKKVYDLIKKLPKY
ncbi:helix-turn-helix transcriptional regulator [Clostridium sp. PL3]|uniref:Helix-turn-helix transcriptional regulator n=1 Tax=Clostridium thailandense TaxID=2794346 RepID=A0A949TUE2_9CLOT|nr:helix-turn-helix transcriptional regulator [Clostridium thailandense]MBV7272071.1 helix-turn-helix transcriptional regulator [Clostridium thailandense]